MRNYLFVSRDRSSCSSLLPQLVVLCVPQSFLFWPGFAFAFASGTEGGAEEEEEEEDEEEEEEPLAADLYPLVFDESIEDLANHI